MSPLQHIDPPSAELLALEPLAFLEALGGPVVFRVPGVQRNRCRALVTLLHGNEPSGLMGLRAWLRRQQTPAVDLLCVLGSVPAALEPPGFAHRMLPGHRDLNRCFRAPFDGPEGQLAEAIVHALRDAHCETIVDLHNNTGPNPAYGVVDAASAERLGLVGLFSHRCVVTELRLGTLFEAVEDVPCVAIECGQSGDPGADDVAAEGIARYAALTRAPAPRPDGELYDASRRVLLAEGVSVAFAEAPAVDADVTFLPAVERYNFERIEAGMALGWSHGPWPVRVFDEHGQDTSREYFEVVDGVLRARAPLMPIMVTASATVAQQDCLCYLLREHPEGRT